MRELSVHLWDVSRTCNSFMITSEGVVMLEGKMNVFK